MARLCFGKAVAPGRQPPGRAVSRARAGLETPRTALSSGKIDRWRLSFGQRSRIALSQVRRIALPCSSGDQLRGAVLRGVLAREWAGSPRQ